MKAMSLRISMQTLSPALTPSECRPEAMRLARSATSSWPRRRVPLMMPWKRVVIVDVRSGVGFCQLLPLRSRPSGVSKGEGRILPRLRKPRRALFHVGADGFGLVGAADQFL